MCCCLCFLSERTCLLLRVAFQRLAASLWAASAPPWALCHLPTCMSTPWSPSMTRFPHQRSSTGLQATPLCPHPLPPGWPAPTSAAWGASRSWSLLRTGTARLSNLSSSYEGTVQQGERMEEGSSRTQANEDGARAGSGWLARLLALHYLQMGVYFSYEDLALVWCWEEKLSCTGITTEHINFLSNTNKKKKTFMNFTSWTFSLKNELVWI